VVFDAARTERHSPMTVVLWLVVVLLVLVGFAGLVFPGLPGTPLVFAGLVLAAWLDGFTRVGWWPTLLVLGALTLLSVAVEFIAGALGAQRVGASGRAVWGATLGGLVGIFFGLPGLVLGPFVGAVLGQLAARRDLLHAGRVGVGTLLGLFVGAIAKIAVSVTMLGVFVAAWLF
jgi:uncharacterized protein YqgC (DUF456 family)